MTTPESPAETVEIVATPLLQPYAGTPEIVDSESAFEDALSQLAQGTGPFAFDAERASGYKYSARAYLIQIKRVGGGLHLIDPIPFGPGHPLFQKLNELISGEEVILHASTQDLPCMRELGINPTHLFDTELAGRIAGLPRVGLGPLVESILNISLAKEHSAVDWSVRPLPQDWLTYAALDVELLPELRDRMYALLEEKKKLKYALQDFAAILKAPPPAPRIDPWRRTSGMHKCKKRDQLAIVRSLWIARAEIAQKLDIAQGRLLNDAAIVECAIAAPKTKKEFEKALRPIGLRARWSENLSLWLDAIAQAQNLPEDQWPAMRSGVETLPPIKVWPDRFPDRYAPLTHARLAIKNLSDECEIPSENLLAPELVRRLCWSPPASALQSRDEESVTSFLIDHGARPWQAELCAPALAGALLEREPLPEEPAEAASQE